VGTGVVVWLLVVVIVSAAWEVRRVWLADGDVTSSAWQQRHKLLRQQLEHQPNDAHYEQFNQRLAQVAAYASKHDLAPEQFVDAITAREVRRWQQQQNLAEQQTQDDYQRQLQPPVND